MLSIWGWIWSNLNTQLLCAFSNIDFGICDISVRIWSFNSSKLHGLVCRHRTLNISKGSIKSLLTVGSSRSHHEEHFKKIEIDIKFGNVASWIQSMNEILAFIWLLTGWTNFLDKVMLQSNMICKQRSQNFVTSLWILSMDATRGLIARYPHFKNFGNVPVISMYRGKKEVIGDY